MIKAATESTQRTRVGIGKTWMAALAIAFGISSIPATTEASAPQADERLCTGGFNTKYGWFLDENSDLLGAREVPGLNSTCIKSTSAGLKLQMGGIGMPVLGPKAMTYDFNVNPPTLSLAVLEPALCEDYGSTGNLELVVRDANDEPMFAVNPQIDSMNYSLGSATLTPGGANVSKIRCHSALSPNAAYPIDDEDSLFSDGMEPQRPDLQIAFVDANDNPIETAGEVLQQAVGGDVTFRVRVKNVGNKPATDVRIREFVPTNSGLQMPVVTRISCNQVTPSQSSCFGSGNRLSENISVLPVGEKRVYELSRKSEGAIGQTMALLQIAAFSNSTNDMESDYQNNSRTLRIQVVDQITVSGTVLTNGQAGGQNPGGWITIDTSVASSKGCTVTGESATCPPGTTGLKFSAEANSDFTFTGFTGCAGNQSNVTDVAGDFTTTTSATCTVVANFYTMPTVTASVNGAYGTISVINQPRVHYNQPAFLTVIPAVGYAVDTIAGCGGVTHDSGQTWKTAPVTADCHVTVTFKIAQHTVTASVVGDGSVTPPVVTAQHGQTATFTVTPGLNHKVLEPTGTCPLPGFWFNNGTEYMVTPITEDCTVEFTFALITYEVTANPDVVNGKIWFLDNGNQVSDTGIDVPHGHTASFNLIPDPGFTFANPAHVTATGCTVVGVNYNTATQIWSAVTSAITANGCVISATFTPE